MFSLRSSSPPSYIYISAHSISCAPSPSLAGDVTEFSLPEPYLEATFDFIILIDVLERIRPSRYGCLFTKLREVSHPGSLVYLHTPTPQAQLVDNDEQNYEAVLPHHVLVAGMAMAGFGLVELQTDKDSNCEGSVYNLNQLPRSLGESACKYSHMIFQRVYDDKFLDFN